MERRIEFLKQQISTSAELIVAYENKIPLVSQENDSLIAQLKETKALLSEDNPVNDAIFEALNEKAQL